MLLVQGQVPSSIPSKTLEFANFRPLGDGLPPSTLTCGFFLLGLGTPKASLDPIGHCGATGGPFEANDGTLSINILDLAMFNQVPRPENIRKAFV